MMLTAWRERDGDRAEVTVSEALADPAQAYLCMACGEPVLPRASGETAAPRAMFEHAAAAAGELCRRNPRRADRRRSLRPGGRRAGDVD